MSERVEREGRGAVRVVARAEDRGADTHDCRAFGDRGLEIVRHAHRQRIEREPARAQLLEERMQRAMRRAFRFGVGFGFGNRHQAAQPQRGQRGDRAREPGRIRRRDAALRRLAADVHLHADVQRRQVRGALLGQALRDLQPVDRMHPVEALGDGARLVRLQRADEMPLELGAQVGERADLVDRFLHVVLAECALAGRVCGAHRVGGKRLRHREQRDRAGRAAGRAGGFVDAAMNGGEAGGEIGHGGANETEANETYVRRAPGGVPRRATDAGIIRTTGASGRCGPPTRASTDKRCGRPVRTTGREQPARAAACAARRQPYSRFSTSCTQCTTGTAVPLCRCAMQPMFADTIICGSVSCSFASLRLRSLYASDGCVSE